MELEMWVVHAQSGRWGTVRSLGIILSVTETH